MFVSDQEISNIENNTDSNNTLFGFTNNMELTGTENIVVMANFSAKPLGLTSDYNIEGKPIIVINNKSLSFEYPIDNNDEITISDILMAMRATIRVDDSSNQNDIIQLRIFSNPDNTTETTGGSKIYSNNPNRVEHIDIDGVSYPDIISNATVYSNGTGMLRASTTAN